MLSYPVIQSIHIARLERDLLRALGIVIGLQKAIEEETAENKGRCAPETSDNWGTIAVNARTFSDRLNTLIASIERARNET